MRRVRWMTCAGLLAAGIGATPAGAAPSVVALDNVPLVFHPAAAGVNPPGVRITGVSDGRSMSVAISSDGLNVFVFGVRTPTTPALAAGTGCTLTVLNSARDRVACPLAGREGVLATLTGGDDTFTASALSQLELVVRAGAGNDTLGGGQGSQTANDPTTLDGETGNDILRATTATTNTRTNLIGRAGNDQLLGGPGFDVMDGGAGSDLIDGGAGLADSASYGGSTDDLTVTPGDGLCNDGGASDTSAVGGVAVPGCSANGVDRDLFRNVESMSTGSGDDDITGGSEAETLVGGSGNDRIEGGDGADKLLGDFGTDTLFARDSIVDTAVSCARASETALNPSERAVVDEQDPVSANCAIVERGVLGSTGPIGVPTPVPPPVVIDEPTPTPETPPLIPATPVEPSVPATEPPGATGAGGGDDGRTPPELQIISPVATLGKTGAIALRVRCVYKAKACAGSVTVTARKAATAKRRGKTAKLRKGQKLGSRGVSIPWGVSKATPVKLTKAASTFLKTSRKPLAVTVTVRARDSAFPTGALATTTRTVRIAARR